MNKHLVFPTSLHIRLLIYILILSQVSSCVHEPIPPSAIEPQDSIINPIDTLISIPIDTTDSLIHTCDPDTVYFEREILPMLISNCAKSGCHDEASAKDGVILTSYLTVFNTGDIKPGDPEDSELYEAITEDKPDKLMPPSPNTPLDQAQKDLIKKWIQQGAENLSCQDSSDIGNCDTLDISYSLDLVPVLDTHCIGCHKGSSPSGGIGLNSHTAVLQAANSGKLLGSISHLPGYSPMPRGADPLPACTISQFKAWIDQGALDN